MRSIWVILVTAGLAQPMQAMAQDGGAKVEITPFKAEGVTVSNTYSVNSAFGEKYELAVPAPFKVNAPRRDDQQIFAVPKPDGTPFLKLYFTTADEQKAVFSSLQLIGATIELVEPEKRLEVAQNLCVKVLGLVSGNSDTARVNVQQNVRIGELPAAELVGNFKNKEGDSLLARIVVIPHPAKTATVIGIVVGHPRQGRIRTVEDIYKTSAALALDSLAFD